MPSKEFSLKQKEIVARKLGYEGPMSMFDEFLKSDPSMADKYGLVLDKYMARGGVVKAQLGGMIAPVPNLNPTLGSSQAESSEMAKRFAFGGTVVAGVKIPDDWDDPTKWGAREKIDFYNDKNITPSQLKSVGVDQATLNWMRDVGGYTVSDPTVRTDTATGQPTITSVPSATATQIEEQPSQIISDSGGAGTATQATVTTAGTTSQAAAPTTLTAKTYDAEKVKEAVETAMAGVTAAEGTVSDKAQITAAEGTVSPEAVAKAVTFDEKYKQLVAEDATREVSPEELVDAQTQTSAPVITAAQAEKPAEVQAMTREMTAGEEVKPITIAESEMAQAEAITDDGLATDAKAVAAKLDKFTVDAGTLAEFVKGDVPAQATVQGQLIELMKSFDDGKTPAWAAGALRAANAAMAARGLGGSSMAGAAVFQAAMEVALPIAAQDAQTFATMNLQNLNNRQQVALANAAAQQNVSLANFNAEQQAALQNSANAFALQSQNLSNRQQTMLANAQIRAAFQGQNLSNQMQAVLSNAARQSEILNINLNNQQQASLQTSANNLQVDLANLSAKQQAAVANAQLQAALELKNLDNKQQAAVLNAARYAEANNLTFTAKQTAMLHNSELMKTIGLANLNAEQAAVLQNAATYAAMDMANLNNRQQAAVVNAQAFLQMDMANLSNKQQTEMFKGQSIVQSLLTDGAATNAAAQFNATSQMQTDQFFESIKAQVNQFNATQSNAMAQFNAGQENAIAQFNSQLVANREQFNAQQKLVIDQSNAEWRRNIATFNTTAINQANQFNAQTALALTTTQYNNMWQGYRDSMQYAFTAGENDADRENRLAIAKIQENATIKAAQATRTANAVNALGSLGATLLGKTSLGQAAVDAAGSVIKSFTDIFKAVDNSIKLDWIDFSNAGITPEALGIDNETFTNLVKDISNFDIVIGPPED